MSAFSNLLVATDFSEPSNRALDKAKELARDLGAKLHLIHAFDIPVPYVTPYEIAVPADFIEGARKEARVRLTALVEKVTSEGIDATGHLSESPAHSAIERAAEEVGADLIVMGTRGNTGLKHILLGSVAEQTLRSSSCAVLTIK